MAFLVRNSLKWPALFLILNCVFALCMIHSFKELKKSVIHIEKKTHNVTARQELLVQDLERAVEKTFKVKELPLPIRYLPFADEEGIITKIKEVKIPGVFAPHNASIIEEGNGYRLFFRYDTPAIGDDPAPFYTNIGCVNLDREFNPLETFSKIETGSPFSEDPRAIKVGDNYLLVYSDLPEGNDTPEEREKKRSIRIAQLDSQGKETLFVTRFNKGSNRREKNWMPFFPDGKLLHFIYSIDPPEILGVPSTRSSEFVQLFSKEKTVKLPAEAWPQKWGALRGGTPPRLVDGEYLSFFHSSFYDHSGTAWYIMGAYTFEATPPYTIRKVSKMPILFKGIYDAPHLHTSNPRVRCIYPAGFVVEEREGREVIQLSCGENDSTVKILTLDKEAFFNSMKAVCY